MNNSQVFLAFALPFSMLPLLLMTDSKAEMGKRFKNSTWVKVCGWVSVIGLTFLNMLNLPDAFAGFVSPSMENEAHIGAYVAIVLIMLLLAWCLYDMYKGNRELIASGMARDELIASGQSTAEMVKQERAAETAEDKRNKEEKR